MQKSKNIETYQGYSIDGTVRLLEDGTVFILTRDKKGLQRSSSFDPARHPKKFGIYVSLPVISPKGKNKFQAFNLTELYSAFFPDKSLPENLRIPEKQTGTQKVLTAQQQAKLF